MTVWLVAIVAGLVGAYALRASMLKEAPQPPKPVVLTVPLASVALPEGRVIALGDIGLVELTKEELEARKYPLSQVMLNPEQIIGRTIRAAIKQGDPFLTTALYLEGSGPDVSQLLRPGYRAATITMRDRNAVLPAQGNQVDVVFRSNPQDAKRRNGRDIPEATVTLLQGVEVLAVKTPRPAPPSAGPRNAPLDLRRTSGVDQPLPIVTLAVTLEQANMLKTVENRGELSLVVRSAQDTPATVDRRDHKLTLETLLGLADQPAPFVTEIYRAGERQTIKFDGGNVVAESFSGPPTRRLPSPTPAPLPPQATASAVQALPTGTAAGTSY